MAIKVIIERQAIPGNEQALNEVLMELRTKAVRAKGYISGETLRSLESPGAYLVVSTWNSLDDWNAWLESSERKAAQARVDALLVTPSRHRVYTNA